MRKPKVGVIGTGQVGTQFAVHLSLSRLADMVLVDINGDLASAKMLELQDLCAALGVKIEIESSKSLKKLRDCQIIVVTAGLTRSPGMERMHLLENNLKIIKTISLDLKKLFFKGILIMVTNPLDIMTYVAYKILKIDRSRVIGMGCSLDTYRLKGILCRRFKDINPQDIDTFVIGEHGKGMVPLFSTTFIGGRPIVDLLSEEKLLSIKEEVIQRGAHIVSFYKGKGSAHLAPGFCVFEIVRSILLDESRVIPVSVFLDGEYKRRGLCIGVACRISKEGAFFYHLPLSSKEQEWFDTSCHNIIKCIKSL